MLNAWSGPDLRELEAGRLSRSARFGLGPWEIDLLVGTAVCEDEVVRLTPTETRLIDRLRSEQGTPVPRGVLLTEVWGYAATVRSRTVDTTLRRLRRKLEPHEHSQPLLVTRRGAGITLEGVRESRPDVSVRRLVRRGRSETLIGRDDIVSRLAERLNGGGWLTLHGPPGVGKTAVAQAIADRWDDGTRAVLLVSITGLSSFAEIESAIQRLIDGGRRDVPVVSVLADLQQPLLILDGAEGVPAAVGERFTEWMAASTLFLTRQEPIRCSAETPVQLQPLSDTQAGVLARAAAAEQDIDLDDELVRSIVGASDGLPLAIRLAVPVAAVGGPDAFATARWHSVQANREASHHHTLHAALSGALRALDGPAHQLLVDLTAFERDFDLAAVDGISPDSLASLMHLHQRGLVTGRGVMHLLTPIRAEAGPASIRATQRLDRWLSTLSDSDALTRSRATMQRADLVAAIRRGGQSDSLAWTLRGVARLVGPGKDIVDTLRLAEARAPDRSWVRASFAGCLHLRGESPRTVAKLALTLQGAARVWVEALTQRDPIAREALALQGPSTVRSAEVPWPWKAEILADLFARDPNESRGQASLKALQLESVNQPVFFRRVSGLLALSALQNGEMSRARSLIADAADEEGPWWPMVAGFLACFNADPDSAASAFIEAAERFSAARDLRGVSGAATYVALMAWWVGEPAKLDQPIPVPGGLQTIHVFLTDPLGVPLASLEDLDGRQVVAAWRRGEQPPDDLMGWPMRVLAQVLKTRPRRSERR